MKEFIQKILENFTEATGIKTVWKPGAANKTTGGRVDFVFEKNHQEMTVEAKKELRNHHLGKLLDLQKEHGPLLVIAENIFPDLKNQLRQHVIGYIDAAGNAFIKTKNHFVFIEGKKKTADKAALKNKVFTKTGTKVIFQFLANPGLINATYREIAEQADVALDTVYKVIHGLKEQQFLLLLDKQKMKLTNTRSLLERWMITYEEKLKPGLFIGRFHFLKEEDRVNWKKLPLKERETLWGGEPAGGLITNYLKPAEFTIYTTETKEKLIKKYKLIPDQNGNIRVYRKFWKSRTEINSITAPALLVYADLVNSGNPRCIETAKKIYEKELHYIG